jgi:hypothetical protein
MIFCSITHLLMHDSQPHSQPRFPFFPSFFPLYLLLFSSCLEGWLVRGFGLPLTCLTGFISISLPVISLIQAFVFLTYSSAHFPYLFPTHLSHHFILHLHLHLNRLHRLYLLDLLNFWSIFCLA